MDERLPFLTKVVPPRRRADLLRRPRLLEFLHAHLDRKLLLVCAPAGFGKTSLLADFAREAEGILPVCWYTLDEADRDPRAFLEYLVASIARRIPGFGARTRRALAAGDPERGVRAVVGTLVSEIQE